MKSFEKQKKVAVIGAGFVGASIAYALTLLNLSEEIVLIDINYKKAQGEAYDITHGVSSFGCCRVYAGDYSDIKNSDLIIITTGRTRKVGESRLDLISDNISIMKNVLSQIKKHYNSGVILVVSNPVDILVSLCDKSLGLPDGKVFGTGCILDSSRFVSCVSEHVGVNIDAVKGYVIGEHGDSQVPLWSSLKISDMPISEYCKKENIEWDEKQKQHIFTRVKNMGAHIISAKDKTHYGIATCVSHLANSILNDKPDVFPVSSVLTGEYGINGVALSVLSEVSSQGIVKRIDAELSASELEALQSSACLLKDRLNPLLKKGV
ncbi:MAG: L-lactate dehydrogenase [Ruminococcaceae bacterium]|nr:L-lactate dehydrogenase [Oscillospiraceae bacterium]